MFPLAAFLGLHFLLRLVVSPGLHVDDADLILFDQALAWGYSEQPPLYSWLFRACTLACGPNLVALGVLRAAILAGTVYLLYLSLRDILADTRLARLGAFAVLLVPVLAWHALNYLTHTLLMAGLCVATFWVLVRLVRAARTLDYALLGLTAGLGVLSKYNYLFFLAAIVLAGLTVAPVRRRLVDPRVLLAGLVAAVVVLPHALWVAGHYEELVQAYRAKALVTEPRRLFGVLPYGLVELTVNMVLVALPLLAVGCLAFPQLLTERPAPGGLAAGCQRWVGRYFLALGGVFAAYVLYTGAGRLHERWLEPFFVLLPVYLACRLSRVGVRPVQWQRLAPVLVVLAVGMTVARGAQFWVGFSPRGVNTIDYSFAGAAETLRPAVTPGTVVVAEERGIGGNFRGLLPDARYVCMDRLACLPPDVTGSRRYVFVWHAELGPGLPAHMAGFARDTLGVDGGAGGPVRALEVDSSVLGRGPLTLLYQTVDRRAAD